MQSFFDRFRHPHDVHAFDDFRSVRTVNAWNRENSVAWIEVEDDDGALHIAPVVLAVDSPTLMAAINAAGTILQCFRPDDLAINGEPALLGWLRLRDGTIVGAGESPICRTEELRRLH